jgi:hypothetical protein
MDPRGIVQEGVDWIYLGQDNFQWRTFVNTVMKLRISEKLRTS